MSQSGTATAAKHRLSMRVLGGAAMVIVLVASACSNSSVDVGAGGPNASSTTATSATGGEGSATTADPSSTTTGPRPTTTVNTDLADGDFDDHTLSTLANLDEFRAMASVGAGGQEVVKFTIADFLGSPEISFMDMNFYTFHDEWYWYRLLNGVEAGTSGTQPETDLSFESIEAVYDWAQDFIDRDARQDTLPLDLFETRDGRIASGLFYQLNHRPVETRKFGLGNLIWFPPVEGVRDETWVLSLEYVDEAPPEQVARFLDIVSSAVPAEIADNLLWAVRSPEHEVTATAMEADQLPWYDRIIRYTELAIPGETEVYSAAIAVGRLRIVDDLSQLNNMTDQDVVIIEQMPDFLPPAAAIISATPQTPLAHVSVLARNRGIPSAYVGGILDNPDIIQLGGPAARVAVIASADGTVKIVGLTDDQYDQWNSQNEPVPISVEQVSIDSLATIVDLGAVLDSRAGPLTETELDFWRLRIGGKAAGMLALLEADSVETPRPALALSVAPYVEHLESVRPALNAMLANHDFITSDRARYLLLEGEDDYLGRYTTERDAEFLARFNAESQPGSLIGDIVGAGGFKKYFRDQPIAPATLSLIETQLAAATALLAQSQGLRFRSSSTVEDIEGFNGAGLYDSNTGFLDLDANPDERAIERAIKKTWASYWSAEAYEERELAAVDHLSGAMAVLIHPRFDDEFEQANGVLTFEISVEPLRGRSPQFQSVGQRYVMTINVQPDANSVVDPDGQNTPEIIVATASRSSDDASVERVAESSINTGQVLSDERVLELYEQARTVSLDWLARFNGAQRSDAESRTVTLDMEFKLMAGEWPALGSGATSEDRIVIKQVRPLNPPLARVQASIAALTLPDDLRRRLRRVETVSCVGTTTLLTYTIAYSDAAITPDLGWSEAPYLTDFELSTGLDSEIASPVRIKSLTGPEDIEFSRGLLNGRLLNGTVKVQYADMELPDSVTCSFDLLYSSLSDQIQNAIAFGD